MEDFLFLLPRPQWQEDDNSSICKRCHVAFSIFNRKHHCRHCGMIYCCHCCSRKTSLRQLGYQEPVKVCEDCFEFAYLISYALNMESKTTQLHGARGLIELLANKDESQVEDFIKHGILETFIFLSQKSLSPELHLLSTVALRFLIENEYLGYLLQSSASHQHSSNTFKVLIQTITSILEVYTLVPEVKGDDIGIYSIHRIIFNAVLSASKIVVILSSYPNAISMLINSRWIYFFLDAIEQAIYDCGYAIRKNNSNTIKKVSNSSNSPTLLYGLFDEHSDNTFYITPTSSPDLNEQNYILLGPPDDLWLIALELQIIASKAVYILCQTALKFEVAGFNTNEIGLRLQHIISLYHPYSNSEKNHLQSSVKTSIQNIENSIQLLQV